MKYKIKRNLTSVTAGLAGLAALIPGLALRKPQSPNLMHYLQRHWTQPNPVLSFECPRSREANWENTIVRAENQLAGYLINPATGWCSPTSPIYRCSMPMALTTKRQPSLTAVVSFREFRDSNLLQLTLRWRRLRIFHTSPEPMRW